ncbi:MAG: enoyl-CoA hydratase [Burkholderiaceae bacterium]|jgi:enoyl-CoA hydratase/carnithine racemase|nr:enoyl-CoA hydratase [Burkholderiaceae bacterium]
MTDALILRHDADAIATLTLNAPASLNALSTPMLLALDAALAALAQDPAIRVVILRGAGRVFSAGHDLKEMQAARANADKGAAYFRSLFELCARVMQRLPALPQPVIAQVHGLAAAAGCQLAASCDLVTAAEDARFGVNGVNIGLFCSTPMVALTRKVPPAVAFEMLTTGEFLTAPRAREVGLVNRTALPEALEDTTQALARTLAAKLSAAVRIGKRGFYDQLGLPLDQAYAETGAAMVENMLWRDTEEGIQAFLDKRKPDWA